MSNENLTRFDDERNDNLSIRLEKLNDACIILFLDGYVDTYNALFFHKQVSKLISSGFTQLIFECSKLTYVSSSAFASFLVFLKTIKPKGGNLVLVNMTDRVYELFRLLALAQFFPIKKSIKEAIQFLQKAFQPTEALFPKKLSCPICHCTLIIHRSGHFRCSECKTIFTVDSKADVFLG